MSPDVKLERSRMRPAGMATLMRLCLLGLLAWGCASGPSAPPATNGSPVAMAPAPTEDGRVHVQIGFGSLGCRVCRESHCVAEPAGRPRSRLRLATRRARAERRLRHLADHEDPRAIADGGYPGRDERYRRSGERREARVVRGNPWRRDD